MARKLRKALRYRKRLDTVVEVGTGREIGVSMTRSHKKSRGAVVQGHPDLAGRHLCHALADTYSDGVRSQTEVTQNTGKPFAQVEKSWKGHISRSIMRRVLRTIGNPRIAIQLGDHLLTENDVTATPSRVILRDFRTLLKLARDPLFQFGEAYTNGTLEVDGDLSKVLALIYQAQMRGSGRGSIIERLIRYCQSFDRNTLVGSRNNIRHHYDLGNSFYRLWLDEQLVYTCAYFAGMTDTLERAQQAKMELICRKLRLQPGEVVVEAGCGWGALAIYMAMNYGVRVHAFNISREQIQFARQHVHDVGLEDRVLFAEGDWREINLSCDAFVSVGMLEHVGTVNYPQLGEVIRRCLKPNGRGLLHSIGQVHPIPLNPWIERRIFPGAYPPTLTQIVGLLESNDFTILDVENLRLHYAMTLKHWLSRFEAAAITVADQFDDSFVRMWRLYLVGSMTAFESGALQLFQVLFSQGSNNAIRWTRNGIYRGSLSTKGN